MATISSHLIIVICLVLVDPEVIALTEDTFSDKVKEKDTAWFVKFCVPWCKHCKNLGSLWEDLGREMEGEDEIVIGEVDYGASKPVCSKVDIHSYPTFKVFYDGEEVAKYQGPRNVESLKAFVLEEADKAARKAQFGDDQELCVRSRNTERESKLNWLGKGMERVIPEMQRRRPKVPLRLCIACR